jgi:16S rRNA (guanine(966)-N(2))-methyltransferase RsmD
MAKGHKLKTVSGNTTRPTSDMVKGALFNIIATRIEDSYVLDVFAGTGSLGIEALSRGAAQAVFFDKSGECCSVIKDNLIHTKLIEKAEIYTTDFAAGIDRLYRDGKRFDVIILDPPYNKNLIQETLKILDKDDIIRDNGIVIAEHDVSDVLPEYTELLEKIYTKRYSDTALTIYARH